MNVRINVHDIASNCVRVVSLRAERRCISYEIDVSQLTLGDLVLIFS